MNKSIRPWIRRAIVPTIALTAIALVAAGCTLPGGGGEESFSSAKAIATYSFTSPPATGTIDENAKTIAVTVPHDTDVTALVATFTTTGSSVTVGSTVQVSGVTANDFTSPVIYAVMAADSSTASYTVTVTVGAWQTVGTAGFSEGLALNISMAIDSTGIPYVAIYDRESENIYNDRATVMKYAGGSWQTVGPRGFSASTPYCHAMALDSTNTPYIALLNGTVMNYVGGSWQTVGATGVASGYNALAVDSTGTPYVVYQDSGNDHKATVKKYVGGSWKTVGTAGFSAGWMWFPSIAIDSTDTPYVAYAALYGPATVMKYDSGSWQTVGTAGISAGRADFTSLSIDSTNTPYVAYVDYANGNSATVMKYSGGSWQSVGTASPGYTQFVSLSIDSTDIPYVASDGGIGCKATVMRYAGGSWQMVGAAGFSAGQAMWVSMAIDSAGTPYVAYQDIENGNKATVMSFK